MILSCKLTRTKTTRRLQFARWFNMARLPMPAQSLCFSLAFPGKFGEISYDELRRSWRWASQKEVEVASTSFPCATRTREFLGDFKSGELFRIFKARIQLQRLQLVEILQILQQQQTERRDGALAKKWQLVLLPLEVGRWAIKPSGC